MFLFDLIINNEGKNILEIFPINSAVRCEVEKINMSPHKHNVKKITGGEKEIIIIFAWNRILFLECLTSFSALLYLKYSSLFSFHSLSLSFFMLVIYAIIEFFIRYWIFRSDVCQRYYHRIQVFYRDQFLQEYSLRTDVIYHVTS